MLNKLLFVLGAFWNGSEAIASAATAFRIPDEYAAFDESGDITQGGIVGAFGLVQLQALIGLLNTSDARSAVSPAIAGTRPLTRVYR